VNLCTGNLNLFKYYVAHVNYAQKYSRLDSTIFENDSRPLMQTSNLQNFEKTLKRRNSEAKQLLALITKLSDTVPSHFTDETLEFRHSSAPNSYLPRNSHSAQQFSPGTVAKVVSRRRYAGWKRMAWPMNFQCEIRMRCQPLT
jgi:hypothetical protein